MAMSFFATHMAPIQQDGGNHHLVFKNVASGETAVITMTRTMLAAFRLAVDDAVKEARSASVVPLNAKS